MAAREAKAWARIGDWRQTEVALDGETKATRCHAVSREPEDNLAGNLADEVIRASTDLDGTERAPMRLAEARITLGVVAAR